MSNSREIYVKENNLAQLSLFNFGMRNFRRTKVEWKDKNGEYELVCAVPEGDDEIKGVPGAFEHDVYTAIMRIWVKGGMNGDTIDISYSQVARELYLKPEHSATRIKMAIKTLAKCRYTFKHCFIRNYKDDTEENREEVVFSLFSEADIFEQKRGSKKKSSLKKSKSTLVFPKQIVKNIETKYYQFLNMKWFRALPSGLPRRLYEFLEKKRYLSNNSVFAISEEKICMWLPIKTKHVTSRRKNLKKISDSLIKAGYLRYYYFNKTKKLCVFAYSDAKDPVYPERVIDVEPEEVIVKETSFVREPIPQILVESTELERLVSLIRLKRVGKATKNLLSKHLKENGSEYVERNILYANDKAKSSYSNYLGKCLANDYAEVWHEEKQSKQEALLDLNEELRQKEKEEKEKSRKELELAELRQEFLEKVEKLSDLFKRMAMDSAKREVDDTPSKEFAIKPTYSMRILDIVNEMGGKYPKEILTMEIMKKLWKERV